MKIEVTQHYEEGEINKCGEDQVRFALNLALIDKLEEAGAIKYVIGKESKTIIEVI